MALTDAVEIPRRTMVLFFVVDTSGSMEGSKLGAPSLLPSILPEVSTTKNRTFQPAHCRNLL